MKTIFIEKYYKYIWGDDGAYYRTISKINKDFSFLNVNDYVKMNGKYEYKIIEKKYDIQNDTLKYIIFIRN